jgi:hypothetical protein
MPYSKHLSILPKYIKYDRISIEGHKSKDFSRQNPHMARKIVTTSGQTRQFRDKKILSDKESRNDIISPRKSGRTTNNLRQKYCLAYRDASPQPLQRRIFP